MHRNKRYVLFVFILFSFLLSACMNNDGLHEDEYQNHGQGYSNDTISSLSTDLSSGEYPHTQAVQIHPALFDFYIIDQEQDHPQEAPDQQPQTDTPQQPDPAPQIEQPQQQEEQQTPTADDETSPAISEAETRVLQLTNEHRTQNGLSELQAHAPLSDVAREKSRDMRENNYFSHTSPTYGSPFDMIRDAGISFTTAGENIAYGQQTAEQVVQAWMDSEGHRQNILNANFTHLGVGYDQNGHHWTQMFISE